MHQSVHVVWCGVGPLFYILVSGRCIPIAPSKNMDDKIIEDLEATVADLVGGTTLLAELVNARQVFFLLSSINTEVEAKVLACFLSSLLSLENAALPLTCH